MTIKAELAIALAKMDVRDLRRLTVLLLEYRRYVKLEVELEQSEEVARGHINRAAVETAEQMCLVLYHKRRDRRFLKG